MNLSAIASDWRKESKGISLTSRSLSNIIRGYDQEDINNMIKQISEGVDRTTAAKSNNIPRGSVARILEKNKG